MYRYVASIALLIASLSASPVLAQAGSGVILFGEGRENALTYSLDEGIARGPDRYFLDLKPQKFKISQIIISYPDTFNGEFDPNRMEVRVRDKPLALQTKKWDKANRTVELTSAEPIPAKTGLTIVLAGVTNPYWPGIYKLDARVMSSDDLPVLRYVGSWVIDFN